MFRDRARSGPARTDALLQRIADRSGLTRSGLAMLGLAVLVWLGARAIGSRTLYLIVYGGLLVLGASWWIGRRRPALEGTRSEMPMRMRHGQRADVTIELTARRRVGTFLIEEKLHPHLGRRRRIPVPGARPGSPFVYRYTINPRLRGVYEVGPLNVIWSDPFGLTQRTVEIVPAVEVIVHPATEAVHDRPLTRQWEDPPIRPPTSKPWPSGFEFYGMRDYAPGDDLRRVVWRAVARTGRVLVREFEQGITDKVAIVLDTDERSHSAGYPSDTFEAAVKTAASIGTRHLRDGFAVSVHTGAERLCAALRGPGAQFVLLDHLARAGVGPRPLKEAVERLAGEPERNIHNVVITPKLDERSASSLRVLLDRGGDVVLVALVWEQGDPATLSLAASLGCQVVQLRPHTPLEAVFSHAVGAGRR